MMSSTTRLLVHSLLFVALLSIALPAHAAKWAVLVGVNDYESPDITHLNYAVDDVKAIAADLVSRVGFPAENISLMTSDVQGNARPTNVNVLKRLDSLSRRIQPGDTFLFYFSGHGFTREGGQHFLATVNADPLSIETLQLTSLPMALLREQMSKIRAANVVFIIDACRNDPEAGKGGGNNLLTNAFTKDLKTVATSTNGGQAGTALLFACGENERSYEEPEWKHGVFTHFLLQGLETRAAVDPGGKLTMASLAAYVQQQVGAWGDDNDKQQHPDLEQQGAALIVLADHMGPSTLTPKPSPVEPTPVVVVPDGPAPPVTTNSNPPQGDLPPITPSTVDKRFGDSIRSLLDACSSQFQSFRGMVGTTEQDTTGNWTLYTCRQDVPGFKNGMIYIHAVSDGNYYDAGNYAEYEDDQHWPSTAEADAVAEWRTISGQVVAAIGSGWSSKVTRSTNETDAVFTRDSIPNFIKLRLIKDRKSNLSILLDVSDGLH